MLHTSVNIKKKKKTSCDVAVAFPKYFLATQSISWLQTFPSGNQSVQVPSLANL
jgi:hypothetical protein